MYAKNLQYTRPHLRFGNERRQANRFFLEFASHQNEVSGRQVVVGPLTHGFSHRDARLSVENCYFRDDFFIHAAYLITKREELKKFLQVSLISQHITRLSERPALEKFPISFNCNAHHESLSNLKTKFCGFHLLSLKAK